MVEIIAVLFSILSVYLTAKKNPLCWPAGIVGVLAYSWIFYTDDLIGNLLLQSVFLGQSVFGWWNWNRAELKFDLKNRLVFTSILGLFPAFYLAFYLSGNWLDITTTILSIIGMLLLAYKMWQSWIFWIIADILYVILFFKVGELLPMINYIIFTAMAIWGLVKWKKENVI